MAVCKKCGYTGAQSNFRRSPKGGEICRDKLGCEHDLKLKLNGQTPGPRSLQALLRF